MVWPRKNIFAEYTHAVPPRFYVPEARVERASIDLPREEASHLTRVLRLGTGARIRVFNGLGDEWEAEVEVAGRHRVSVRLGVRVAPAREARVPIALAVAVLKGDKMDDIVRDAVMLGVSGIQPLLTARTEVSRAAIERSGRVPRWQRIAVGSAKQCGRAVVPAVCAPASLEEAIRRASHPVLLVEPSAAATAIALAALPAVERLTLFVGPEGGWTEEEVRAAGQTGAMLMTLGTLTLRADAVPIVALTAVRVRLEDF
jgi:16S rRNA (uracil1498-N3)-methyltransferase